MLLALSHKRFEENDPDNFLFPTSQLFSFLGLNHKPLIYIISSLHNKNQIFGFICTLYKNAYDFLIDEYYVNWCDAVSNGLQILQMRLRKEFIKQQFETLSDIEPFTGLYNRRGLMEHIPDILTHCNSTNKKCIVTAISYQERESEISILTTLANALRIKQNHAFLIARPDHNVIVLAYISDTDDENQLTDLFLENISKHIRKVYGCAIQTDWNQVAINSTVINNNQITNMEYVISDLIQKTVEFAIQLSNGKEDYRYALLALRQNIRESPHLNWSVEYIAERIGISRSHLQRLYREMFGSGCMDDVIQIRIDTAKKLLQNTNQKISEIAEACGYSNESHFMRQFKQKTGMTASEFRKALITK